MISNLTSCYFVCATTEKLHSELNTKQGSTDLSDERKNWSWSSCQSSFRDNIYATLCVRLYGNRIIENKHVLGRNRLKKDPVKEMVRHRNTKEQ